MLGTGYYKQWTWDLRTGPQNPRIQSLEGCVAKLHTYRMNLFSEEPWIIKAKGSEMKQAVKDLASNLSFYCADYLNQ